MKAVVVKDPEQGYQVWASLGNADDPREEPESFVLGLGDTMEEAIASARIDLQDALKQLEPGNITVVDS